ncbi:hypothetical protein FRC09_005361, partial [Ceratobasidium sp. 395]
RMLMRAWDTRTLTPPRRRRRSSAPRPPTIQCGPTDAATPICLADTALYLISRAQRMRSEVYMGNGLHSDQLRSHVAMVWTHWSTNF